jgi:hypothetical protein
VLTERQNLQFSIPPISILASNTRPWPADKSTGSSQSRIWSLREHHHLIGRPPTLMASFDKHAQASLLPAGHQSGHPGSGGRLELLYRSGGPGLLVSEWHFCLPDHPYPSRQLHCQSTGIACSTLGLESWALVPGCPSGHDASQSPHPGNQSKEPTICILSRPI